MSMNLRMLNKVECDCLLILTGSQGISNESFLSEQTLKGHKVKRRSSFIRVLRAARDIGKTLRQIRDDLESRHIHSSQSVSSQLW